MDNTSHVHKRVYCRHFDTLLGLRAKEEVFPHILAWCREMDDVGSHEEEPGKAIRACRRWGEVEENEQGTDQDDNGESTAGVGDQEVLWSSEARGRTTTVREGKNSNAAPKT